MDKPPNGDEGADPGAEQFETVPAIDRKRLGRALSERDVVEVEAVHEEHLSALRGSGDKDDVVGQLSAMVCDYARLHDVGRVRATLSLLHQAERDAGDEANPYRARMIVESLLYSIGDLDLAEAELRPAISVAMSDAGTAWQVGDPDVIRQRVMLFRLKSLELEIEARRDPTSPRAQTVLEDLVEFGWRPATSYDVTQNALRILMEAGAVDDGPAVAALIEQLWAETARAMEFGEYDLSDRLKELRAWHDALWPGRGTDRPDWGRDHVKPILEFTKRRRMRPGATGPPAPDANPDR